MIHFGERPKQRHNSCRISSSTFFGGADYCSIKTQASKAVVMS